MPTPSRTVPLGTRHRRSLRLRDFSVPVLRQSHPMAVSSIVRRQSPVVRSLRAKPTSMPRTEVEISHLR